MSDVEASSSTGGSGVAVEAADGVVTVTLDRPARKNALSKAMVRELTAVAEGVGREDGTRVVVLRASGPDFCSGIDLVESNDPNRGGGRPRTGHMQRDLSSGAHGMIRAFHLLQTPVVAAVRGWAAGIGNSLALSADVVVADTTARFWVPMVARGFTPDSGNTWLLPRLIGLPRAKEMLLRAKPVDAERAERWGLISRCVAPDQLDAALAEVVDELGQAATLAVGLTKAAIHRNLGVDLDAALQSEGMYEELAIRSDDFKEGIRAFMRRETPYYKGR